MIELPLRHHHDVTAPAPTSPAMLVAPRLAWPTLLLLALALALWLAGVGLAFAGVAPGWSALALCTLGAYLAFTPMHEAAHRTLARAHWINEVVGRVAALPLMAPFPAVRFLHLAHHRHTNEPDADPDHWSGRGPAWALPLRWLTQDLYYYAVYLEQFGRRPARERLEATLTLAGFVGLALGLAALGHGRAVLLCWALPARLALGVLAFALDWLPHHPHTITARQDRYRATRAFEGRLAHLVTIGQSLHLVHHLYPGVPFYRYARVWRSGAARRPAPRTNR